MVQNPWKVRWKRLSIYAADSVELRRLHMQVQWKEHTVSYFRCMMVRIYYERYRKKEKKREIKLTRKHHDFRHHNFIRKPPSLNNPIKAHKLKERKDSRQASSPSRSSHISAHQTQSSSTHLSNTSLTPSVILFGFLKSSRIRLHSSLSARFNKCNTVA